MKIALAVMGAMVVVMIALIVHQRRWVDLWGAIGGQARGLLPILLLAVLFAACVEVLVPAETIARWLGESSGGRGIVIAWIAGVLTPGAGRSA